MPCASAKPLVGGVVVFAWTLRHILAVQQERREVKDKDFTGDLFFARYFISYWWGRKTSGQRNTSDQRSTNGQQGDTKMAWKAPKIAEVPVGMEINMYACAARK